MEFFVILIVLFAIVIFVTGPLRRSDPRAPVQEDVQAAQRSSEIAELEAAREAKYREIRDADLDHQTGKLSDADYGELDATLRAEALEILGALDRVQAAAPGGR
jgi:hypothetical protein